MLCSERGAWGTPHFLAVQCPPQEPSQGGDRDGDRKTEMGTGTGMGNGLGMGTGMGTKTSSWCLWPHSCWLQGSPSRSLNVYLEWCHQHRNKAAPRCRSCIISLHENGAYLTPRVFLLILSKQCFTTNIFALYSLKKTAVPSDVWFANCCSWFPNTCAFQIIES